MTAENLKVSIGLLDCFYTGQSPDVLTVFRAGQSPARRRLGVTGGCWGVWKGRPHPQRVESKHHRGGGGPSTLVEAEAGNMRRLHAKDCMAAVARRAVQREVQARAADRRRDGGVDDALWFARSRMKVTASSLQRPPISIPSTTSRARPAPVSSGYVRAFARRAMRNAAAAVLP